MNPDIPSLDEIVVCECTKVNFLQISLMTKRLGPPATDVTGQTRYTVFARRREVFSRSRDNSGG
jgi:hypothetical protein